MINNGRDNVSTLLIFYGYCKPLQLFNNKSQIHITIIYPLRKNISKSVIHPLDRQKIMISLVTHPLIRQQVITWRKYKKNKTKKPVTLTQKIQIQIVSADKKHKLLNYFKPRSLPRLVNSSDLKCLRHWMLLLANTQKNFLYLITKPTFDYTHHTMLMFQTFPWSGDEIFKHLYPKRVYKYFLLWSLVCSIPKEIFTAQLIYGIALGHWINLSSPFSLQFVSCQTPVWLIDDSFSPVICSWREWSAQGDNIMSIFICIAFGLWEGEKSQYPSSGYPGRTWCNQGQESCLCRYDTVHTPNILM